MAPWMAPPAAAQTLRPVITSDGPLPPLRGVTRRRPDQAAPEEVDAAPAPAPPARVPADDGSEPGVVSDDPAAEPVPPRPTGLRPAVRDGDPAAAVELEPSVDGAVQTEPDPYENPDGADPVAWDARSLEDASPFERPPAGYDAELFRAEISPLLDRRPERLARFEPWQPRGIRFGSFIVYPTVDVGYAALSNVFRTRPAQADQAFELRPSVLMRSDWRTHALEVRASGALTYFDTFPAIDDRAWSLEARGRLDITRRTQLTGLVLHDVMQEAPGTLALRLAGGARADVTTDQTALTFNQRFNRLTIELRGTTLQRDFSEVRAANGTITSNRDRDVTVSEQTARATWAFKPTLLAFAEAGINQREFQAVSPLDGIARNSSGERYRLGVGFGNTSQILRGEVSIGYGEQTPDDHRLAAINGMLIDANAAWRIDALNAMLLRASTDVLDTSAAGSAGGFVRRASLEWRHAFLRPLIGTAGVFYSATDYQGIALSENLTDYVLGLEYYLAPEALIYGRVQHSSYRISNGANNWDADEFRIGVRLRQ